MGKDDADFLNKPVRSMTDAEVMTLLQVMQIDIDVMKKRIEALKSATYNYAEMASSIALATVKANLKNV